MLHRLVREESGMTMGLVVIMIALIGVMGAGLLVFVRNDLETVVQVNQGQRALNLADAGVQAAKRQLRSDAVPAHYDSNSAENVEWAYVVPSGTTAGKTLSLDEGSAKVTVQYLLPSTSSAEVGNKDHAPERVPTNPPGQTTYPGDKNYFKIVSEGTAGEARRKVEAIFYTSKLDVPTAYYTLKDITIQGNIDISGVSFFAKGNITRSGDNVTVDRNTPALYGDWDTTKFDPPSNLNTRPRRSSSGQSVQGAGFAAEGTVADFGGGTRGVYDYDRNTATRFVRKANPDAQNAAGTISYPFNPDTEFDLDFLMEEAKRQGNYKSSPVDISNSNYPGSSNEQTVFFVDDGGNTSNLQYKVSQNRTSGSNGVAQGTIIVRDGNLTINDASGGFNGIIIVTGDGTNTGKYDSGGSDTVQGFVIASGDMTIHGSTEPFAATKNFTTRPGFYGVNLWSWRELYQ
jgi:hypothetical protein